jgi:hypothetical protein
MTQLGEAVARYHKLLESASYRDLNWAREIQDSVRKALGSAAAPISPVLRPHFLTRRQYDHLVKAAEALYAAISRVETLVLANPQLMARMQLLPAEKMLAAVDPGYPHLFVTSLLDTHLNNGNLRFVEHSAETPAGVIYGEALADAFLDAPPVREFRKKYKLTKLGGLKHFLNALLKSYKDFGHKKDKPHIAILEFRAPFPKPAASEVAPLARYFTENGCPAQIVSPDQLEYKNGVLRSGDFTIDLVYRRVKVQEFLVRYDLAHPLVRAYRDRAVCLINSFRSEIGQKKAIFDLLTDETVTAAFPAAERKAIREFIPWTRLVNAVKTTHNGKTVDLPDFIMKQREKLVMKPNDANAELPVFRGPEMDDTAWERALRQAMRTPYVVQELVEANRAVFPLFQWGHLEYKDMRIDVQPHTFLGKVHGASTWLHAASSGFSSAGGLAPTFVLEVK